MNDTTESGQPEAQPRASVFQRVEATATADLDRVLAAIESWYAEHFHRASVAGVAPIPAADKASLIAHVTAAVSTKPE